MTLDCVSYLSEGLAEFSQNALLIKHLALVSVLIVVVDFLPEIGRQLVEGHILLHLFVLRGTEKMFCECSAHNNSDRFPAVTICRCIKSGDIMYCSYSQKNPMKTIPNQHVLSV